MRLYTPNRWFASLFRTRLTRRDLLALFCYGLAGSLAPPAGAAPGGASALAGSTAGGLRSTLSAFLDTLLPEDEYSPSASRLGVADRLLAEAERDALYARLIRAACEWIDLQTEREFASAPEPARVLVVIWMSKAQGNSVPRRFFELVRDHAFALYYSDSGSWPGTGFQHPPQPVGYPEVGQ